MPKVVGRFPPVERVERYYINHWLWYLGSFAITNKIPRLCFFAAGVSCKPLTNLWLLWGSCGWGCCCATLYVCFTSWGTCIATFLPVRILCSEVGNCLSNLAIGLKIFPERNLIAVDDHCVARSVQFTTELYERNVVRCRCLSSPRAGSLQVVNV